MKPRAIRAVTLLAFLLAAPACRKETDPQVVLLDAETLDAYLEAYRVIGPAYRKAYEAGASPSAIPRRQDIRTALDKAGWSWDDYQSVHGSVSNAMLFIEDEEAFRSLRMGPEQAPPQNVELIRDRYFELKQARLIVEEVTYQ